MVAKQWPIEEADLGELVLDPRNVRVRAGRGEGLSDVERTAAEAAILKYMIEAEELIDLMRGILRDGYLDNEIPVVVRDGSELVVMEGNRRVSALKVINSPALLGSGSTHVERHISRYPDHGSPTKIRVMIAPSREDALPLVARLHTGKPKKSWLIEQQAIFFHAQIDEATSVDDLRVSYPDLATKIPQFIRMGEMREVIRSIHYDDPDLRGYVMNSELKMTGFEYAYRPKKIHQALGLEFTPDGLLISKRLSEDQCRGLVWLLEQFRSGALNTRSRELIAKYPEHDHFVERLRKVVAGETASPPAVPSPRPVPGPSDDASDANHGGGREARGEIKTEKETSVAGDDASHIPISNLRGPNRGETRSRLATDGFEYMGTSAGMRRRFEELQRINVRDFPYATHDLIRTVLECSIKEYLRTWGTPVKPRATLGNCIEELARQFKDNSRMTAHINAIKRTGRMSADQYAGTADSLNTTNHEPDQVVVVREVHDAWDRLKPILIQIVGSKPTNP